MEFFMALIYTDELLRANCPEEAGVDTFVLRDFFSELKSSGYAFKNIMVLRHGRVVAECTRYPYVNTMPHTMFSFSKVVTSIAIGFAVSEGLLRMDTSVEELFGDSYDEKQMGKNKAITVRNLLTMTSGKKLHFINDYGKMDWLDNYITSRQPYKAGEKFKYLSDNTYILGRMLAKVSGLTIGEYLKPRFFEPLKIEYTHWDKDPQGYDAGGWGLFLTIEDMAKICQCMLDNGVFNGVQVIPDGWVEAMTTPHVHNLYGLDAKNLGYGYNTWCGREDGYYRLEGLYGQFAFMYPKHGACVVMNSGGIDHKTICTLIDKYFPLAFKDNLDVVSEDIAEEFKEQLKSFSYDVLPTAPRNYATELGLNGKVYTIKNNKKASLLPCAATYMFCNKPGSMNNLEFKFNETYAEILWDEKNAQRNTLCVNLDSKRRISRVQYGDLTVHMLAFGSWNTDGTLNVQIFTMECPEVRTWKINFGKNNIDIKSDIFPTMEMSIQNKMRFEGIKTNKFLDLCVKLVHQFVCDFMYVGRIRGKLKK